jgi:hypothetical protein
MSPLTITGDNPHRGAELLFRTENRGVKGGLETNVRGLEPEGAKLGECRDNTRGAYYRA